MKKLILILTVLTMSSAAFANADCASKSKAGLHAKTAATSDSTGSGKRTEGNK